MVEPLRHRQTKGAATDMFYLMPPRHISTLPNSEVSLLARHVRCTLKSRRRQAAPACPLGAQDRKWMASGSMASRGPCGPRLLRDPADHFASCPARYASASFFSSSAVSFGGSSEIVSLLILPVNVNGI